jgi:hypothetical protein
MALFRPDPGLERALRRQAAHRAGMRAAAEVVAESARTLARAAGAPWMPRKGAAEQPIVVETDGDENRVVNTDHGGHLTEFGSVNNPPLAPLRRGVRAAGLRLDEQDRT